MYDSLFHDLSSFNAFSILVNVIVACLLGFLISSIYHFSYKGYSYSPSFVHTLILITMITSIVIMVIGNNLARAFGLVGAMSIIRFRTVLKDTRDIAFVFWALAAGVAIGAEAYLVGIFGTLGIGLIVLALYYSNYGTMKMKDTLLKFSVVPEKGDEKIYKGVFEKYVKSYNLLDAKSIRMGQLLELTFHVRFRNPNEQSDFLSDLSAMEGVERVMLHFGEEWDED
jgi:uncharacterized membrane protein YhiD involved in acid resistance